MKAHPIKKLSPGKLRSTFKPTPPPSLVSGSHVLFQSLLATACATSQTFPVLSLTVPTFTPLPSALAPPGSEQQPQATAQGPTGTTCFPRTAAPAPHGLHEPWRLPGAAPKHPAPTVPPSAAPLGLLTKPTHHHSANKNRRESSDGYSERFNVQQDGGR